MATIDLFKEIDRTIAQSTEISVKEEPVKESKQSNDGVDPFISQVICSIPNLKAWLKGKLDARAAIDPTFLPKYLKPSKSIDECERYIIEQMRLIAMKHKQGNMGFVGGSDEDLVNIAVHYYDEDSIKVDKPKAEKKAPKAEPNAATPAPRAAKPKTEKKTQSDNLQLSLF